jgi:hypothetical protein
VGPNGSLRRSAPSRKRPATAANSERCRSPIPIHAIHLIVEDQLTTLDGSPTTTAPNSRWRLASQAERPEEIAQAVRVVSSRPKHARLLSEPLGSEKRRMNSRDP